MFRSYLFLLIFSFIDPIILINNMSIFLFKGLILWRPDIIGPFIILGEISPKYKFHPAFLTASNIMLMEGLVSLPLYSTASLILSKDNRRLIALDNPLLLFNSLILISKSLFESCLLLGIIKAWFSCLLICLIFLLLKETENRPAVNREVLFLIGMLDNSCYLEYRVCPSCTILLKYFNNMLFKVFKYYF